VGLSILLGSLSIHGPKGWDEHNTFSSGQVGFLSKRLRNYCNVVAFVSYWRKNLMYNEIAHQLFMDFKKDHNSDRNKLFYNILIQCGVHMKLVRLIKCV
jgi:hypothetical protein